MGLEADDFRPSTVDSLKLVVADNCPSLTVRLTIADPFAPERGLKVTVRVLPLPPKLIPVGGKYAVSDVAAVNVRAAAGV